MASPKKIAAIGCGSVAALGVLVGVLVVGLVVAFGGDDGGTSPDAPAAGSAPPPSDEDKTRTALDITLGASTDAEKAQLCGDVATLGADATAAVIAAEAEAELDEQAAAAWLTEWCAE